jgi:uncharacterized protein YndB with AHSA1/START domain
MDEAVFRYVTYIASTPEKVWSALMDVEMTTQYWKAENVSDWKPGSRWEHREPWKGGKTKLVGRVVEHVPPHRLVVTWAFPADEGNDEKHSRVTYEIESVKNIVRLTVTHDRLEPGSAMLEGITDGWPKVLAGLKTLLETGKSLPDFF